jgi:hypothetical protein
MRFLWSRWLPVALISTGLLTLTACSSADDPRPPAPAERIVSLGFEDVVAEPVRLSELAARLDEVRATGVSISVGRSDWTAFPWPAVREAESGPVRETGTDYVAAAIDALRTDATGRPRAINLSIDALVPRWIEENPSVAGVDPDGTRSEVSASLASLQTGAVGERLLAMAAHVAERYRPESVSFTELHFDDATFGADDLRAYREYSGRADWPRTASGAIAENDVTIPDWRSRALGDLVGRAAAIVRQAGSRMEMDVRVPWEDPAGDRAESGHDYDVLLTASDRLVLWNYFALQGEEPSYAADLARATQRRAAGRFVMSIGLWARGDEVVTPEELSEAITAAADGGARAVAVTPTVLMTPAHWSALDESWAG